MTAITKTRLDGTTSTVEKVSCFLRSTGAIPDAAAKHDDEASDSKSKHRQGHKVSTGNTVTVEMCAIVVSTPNDFIHRARVKTRRN